MAAAPVSRTVLVVERGSPAALLVMFGTCSFMLFLVYGLGTVR